MSTASSTTTSATTTRSRSLILAVWSGVALMRVLVGYAPHSGQDNYHGQTAAYGGDYEAQRHWMELTWQLPLSEWYWYDLNYWGLDYPPLTAYVSYVCGGLSSVLVGPESVALLTSRGFEDPVHKSYLRGTVLVTDLLFYGTAVWALISRQEQYQTYGEHYSRFVRFGLSMMQPALLLIDHGHFQYNTTALGLALWAFYYITSENTRFLNLSCIAGSIAFCMALSFKQMTLYYAPAVFFYLLGRAFGKERQAGFFNGLGNVLKLGITVVCSFVALWWPFVAYGPKGTSHVDRGLHVLGRIFPLKRGLFEGKVSNLWCALSTNPVNIRDRIPVDVQPLAALAGTVMLILPLCYPLFRTGRSGRNASPGRRSDIVHQRTMLWGSTSSALAFFLASFQVHEKSLLLALAPASLLDKEDATFCQWFAIVTTWTLWPLVCIDRLQTAYVCTILMYVSLVQLRRELTTSTTTPPEDQPPAGFFEQNRVVAWIPTLSYMVMAALHGAEWTVDPPDHLPDLFPVLWSIAGCAFCMLAWLITCWHLYRSDDTPKRKSL